MYQYNSSYFIYQLIYVIGRFIRYRLFIAPISVSVSAQKIPYQSGSRNDNITFTTLTSCLWAGFSAVTPSPSGWQCGLLPFYTGPECQNQNLTKIYPSTLPISANTDVLLIHMLCVCLVYSVYGLNVVCMHVQRVSVFICITSEFRRYYSDPTHKCVFNQCHHLVL